MIGVQSVENHRDARIERVAVGAGRRSGLCWRCHCRDIGVGLCSLHLFQFALCRLRSGQRRGGLIAQLLCIGFQRLDARSQFIQLLLHGRWRGETRRGRAQQSQRDQGFTHRNVRLRIALATKNRHVITLQSRTVNGPLVTVTRRPQQSRASDATLSFPIHARTASCSGSGADNAASSRNRLGKSSPVSTSVSCD